MVGPPPPPLVALLLELDEVLLLLELDELLLPPPPSQPLRSRLLAVSTGLTLLPLARLTSTLRPPSSLPNTRRKRVSQTLAGT